MNKKLKIGDKFIWNLLRKDKEFTILDIDTSRPSRTIDGIEIKSEILLQWEDAFGNNAQTWAGDYDSLNNLLNRGVINIVSNCIEPTKRIKKFTL